MAPRWQRNMSPSSDRVTAVGGEPMLVSVGGCDIFVTLEIRP